MTGPDQDEEDILKVPLAVAAVKLLQKLPSPQFLEINLPGYALERSFSLIVLSLALTQIVGTLDRPALQ